MRNIFFVCVVVFIIGISGTISIHAWEYMLNEIKIDSEANLEVTEACETMLIVEETVDETVEETKKQMQEQEFYDSLELLAICVEAEAGNQDLMGKRLVVDVILNRVDAPDFPNDIEGVITQRNQFSSYTDGGMDKVTEPSEETFEAIQLELEHRTDEKILFFSAYDYNKYCIPAYQHGDHYFGY